MIISPNKCNYYINSNEVGCLMTSPAMYPFFHYRGRDGVVCFADIWCLQATRKEVYHYGGGGLGPRHFNLKKHDFALWVGVMAGTCTHNLRVVLGPCAHCWPRSNKWSKNNTTECLAPFDSSRRADHFFVVECQNRIKDHRVMPIQSWGKSGVLAYFGPKIGHFKHIFWDAGFKFVLPVIYINIKGQTHLKVNTNVNGGQNKFVVHISKNMAQTRPGRHFCPIRPHQNDHFVETNRTKLYLITFNWWVGPIFLLRGLIWAALRAWTQTHPQVLDTFPGHHSQPIAQNYVFKSARPGPPLNLHMVRYGLLTKWSDSD